MYHRAVEQSPDDYELWGSLADAYSHTDDRTDLAVPMYQNAASLAARQLAVNPANADVLAALGHYHAGLGEPERALDYTRRAVAAAPGDMYVHYFSALTLSQLGREADAIDALQRALDSGYPAGLVAVDAGFDRLAGSEQFRSLLPPGATEGSADD
jgi:tetratricopeptide (TPR) repeat protein